MTPSITPSVTPSITPTTSVTPTKSVTPSSTPSVTPSKTPSVTPSLTPTPSITPSSAGVAPAYLLIEPASQGNAISTYMNNNSASWYGFTFEIGGPTSSSDIETYMDYYSSNAGTGGLPQIYTTNIPQDDYLFDEITIDAGTVSETAWYTFLIPDESIGGSGTSNRAVGIELKEGGGSFSEKTMVSTWYQYTVSNPGGSFQPGTYRLYSTYSDYAFKLDNSSISYTFRGSDITP